MKQELIKGQYVPFTQLANCVLYDKKLSLKAKGLFAYLYSKPDGWEFSGDRIADELGEGRKVIYAAMVELIENKYVMRKKHPTGKMTYELWYQPVAQKGQEGSEPVAPFGKEPKRQRAQTGSISNIVSINNTDLKSNMISKDITEAKPQRTPNLEITTLITHLKNTFHLQKLDGTDAVNRRYCFLALKKFGKEELNTMIRKAADNDFWRPQVTGFKVLYYNGVKILALEPEQRIVEFNFQKPKI